MCHFVYLRKTFSRSALLSQWDMWFSGDITQVAAYETPASPPLEISSVAAVLDQHTSRQRSENMWWGCEYTVMRVWIHSDEGVNTLWWGCEWCVNEERYMKSCTYLMYDVRSFEVSIYLWNHHANLGNKHITSKWFLLPWERLCFGI